MANASDIITYIGVPLAVLGVLPILYTFMLSILTQRRIRSLLLHHGHRPVSTSRPNDGFTLRSSPMTSMVEVELPRYTIAPLDRHEEQYWKTTDDGYDAADGASSSRQRLLERGDRVESTLSMIEEGRVRGYLRGGSWRAFHWKKLIVGRKLYRIQYEDELREPPAEVGFEELVLLLLDWGAVPDGMGWEKLRSGGLWTPSGTVLLRRPDDEDEESDRSSNKKRNGVDWVLRTSMPDESDGILSLTIRWSRDDDSARSVAEMRGAGSLPPGWGRLHQPALLKDSEKREENKKDLAFRIEELKSSQKPSIDSTSFRFHAEGDRVKHVLWEHNNVETGFACDPFRYGEQAIVGLWFTCAASSLLSHKKTRSAGGLWAFEAPSEVKTFVRKDSIPCGVLVMLGILPESEAPQWSTQKDHSNDGIEMGRRHHQAFQARLAAERLEATMPPEQARVHREQRRTREMQETHNNMMETIRARQEREERMVKDAIASPRMGIRKVAEACLRWLIDRGEVGKEWTVEDLAEAVLYLIVVELQHEHQKKLDRQQNPANAGTAVSDEKGPSSDDADTDTHPKVAEEKESEVQLISAILDEWASWASAGGMKTDQYLMLDHAREKMAFCFAAALVAVVAQDVTATSDAGMGRGGADMLECFRLWRKVRLG